MLASCVTLTRAAVNWRVRPRRSAAISCCDRVRSLLVAQEHAHETVVDRARAAVAAGARHLRHHDVRLGHLLGGRRGDVVHEALHVVVAHALGRRRTHPDAAAILERRELARQRNVDRKDHGARRDQQQRRRRAPAQECRERRARSCGRGP